MVQKSGLWKDLTAEKLRLNSKEEIFVKQNGFCFRCSEADNHKKRKIHTFRRQSKVVMQLNTILKTLVVATNALLLFHPLRTY